MFNVTRNVSGAHVSHENKPKCVLKNKDKNLKTRIFIRANEVSDVLNAPVLVFMGLE